MCLVEIAELGSLLKARRTAAGRTIASVAGDAGLSVPYIANLENGRGNPTLTALAAVATALGTSLNVTLGDAPPPVRPFSETLAHFARTPRFAAAVPSVPDRERCLNAMAAMASLTDRELSEVDCHRLLDAVLLLRMK